MTTNVQQLTVSPDHRVAYCAIAGHSPTVLFCAGYRSDMTGTKALALEAHCRGRGQSYVRFDYRGHGVSLGDFEALTVSDWLADAVAIVDQVVKGPVVIVGSSMGGWIMALLARTRPERIAGLVGIACAPDFTDRVIAPALDKEQQRTLADVGVLYFDSQYDDEPYPVTARLLKDGHENGVLGASFTVTGPVRLIHGTSDPDVPWSLSVELAETLDSDDLTVTLVRNAEHRLSSPRDLNRIMSLVDEVLGVYRS